MTPAPGYQVGYRAGRRDERSDVVRWLLAAAETSERSGARSAARALLGAVNALLSAEHA